MKTKGLAAPYLVWMAIFTLVPLGIVLFYALTDSVSGSFTLANLARIGSYMPIFLKSVWLAILSSAICLVIGYPVAYYIASCSPMKQRFLYMLLMLPMCMSFLLRTLAWVALLEDTGIISGITMVFVPAVSTFYISQKMGSSGTTLIGDVIESQFKAAYNPNLGAALSLALMVLVFACTAVMNRFGDGEEVVVL